MNDFLTAVPLGLLLVLSTGPVFFVLIETSLTKGVRAAFFVDLGAVTADLLFIYISFLGTHKLLDNLESNPYWLIFGGTLLITYSLISIIHSYISRNTISPLIPPPTNSSKWLGFFIKGFFLNIINIGSLFFWLGLFVYFAPKLDMNNFRIIRFFSFILLTYLFVDLIKIFLAKQLQHKLTPVVVYKLKQTVHFLILIFGLYFITQGLLHEV